MSTSLDTKQYSNKQEKMIAKELGGYQVGMSGAAPANPGDVKTYEWLIECKTHCEPDQNIFFDLNVWNKIKNEAMGMCRKPVLIVDDGSQRAENTWCLCKASNLNLTAIMTADLPVKIRKNISCKNEKLMKSLVDQTARYIGAFYQDGVFEVDWNNEKVIICPLNTFKELFER